MAERLDLDALYRAHAAGFIARLVRISGGRVDWAEAAVHDAFVAAATQLDPAVVERPAGWIHRAARHRLTDRARREKVRLGAAIEAPPETWEPSPTFDGEWDDELVRMIIATCHPALTPDEQVTLVLHILFGLSVPTIATLFVAAPEAVKKRAYRAKRKLREVFGDEIPGPGAVGPRLPAALRAIYAVFTEGHKPRLGDRVLKEELCAEAIRLAEVLARKVDGDGATVQSLLALMKLTAARLPARQGVSVVLLDAQDRTLWDGRLIDEGLRHLAASAGGPTLTATHLEAGIAACHALAPDMASTDWQRVVSLYDALVAFRPSVIVGVGRAVAVGWADGAEEGLAALRALPASDVRDYLPYHAALGNLALRAGDRTLALSAHRVARTLSQTDADRAFFDACIRTDPSPGSGAPGE